jgi:hypothetical protein
MSVTLCSLLVRGPQFEKYRRLLPLQARFHAVCYLGWHSVAVVQYTFTHKQYTEYRERNIHNNKKKKTLEVRAVPRLCELYPGIYLTIEETARKNFS